MYSLIFLIVASFLLSTLLTPLVRNAFRRWGVAVHSDSTHPASIPRVGGIAIVLSYLLSYGLLLAVGLKAGILVWSSHQTTLALIPAAALVFAAGLVDDIRRLEPWQKLGAQLAAAGLAYWAGFHILAIGGHYLSSWWSLPATLLWLLACTNALNLIDGVDGLGAGVGLFAATTTFLAALLQHNVPLALATAPLVGCLLGFLRYNFNPATVFLGNSGTLFIGFLLGCYSILWSQKAATILGMTAPLMALSIPLLDALLGIARRFLRRQPLFEGDRNHIHHRLLKRGLTPRRVTLILYACCALGAVCSLLTMNQNLAGLIVIVFCAMAWIGIQHLGYAEFGTAGRMFLEGTFRRLLDSQIALQGFEERVRAAKSAEECWQVVQEASRDFGFTSVRMSLGGQVFEWHDPVDPVYTWELNVPVVNGDRVLLKRPFGGCGKPGVVGPFADSLRNTLGPKLEGLALEQNQHA